jgi:glycerol-3-phosphate acyltransferase PlsX
MYPGTHDGEAPVAMTEPVRIAIDAMGGDHGPEMILPGALRALDRHQDIRFLFFGDEKRLRPILESSPRLAAVSSLHHTDVAVRMEDKPSQALRAGRRVSSMWLAIEAVKKGEADVAFSAGNTGALMAMSKLCLHMMAHIDRPAIAAIWPTIRGQSIVLDVGATIGANAQHLFDLAVMGSAMARIVLDLPRPKVGLLNVGVEEIKGIEEVKAASRLLREAPLASLEYFGFVEGDDIGRGTVDVVVTEGFAGNIALKTAEGTAKQISQYLREAMSASWLSKLGYLLARPAFARLRGKMDPRNVNGGVFLGLDGVVIKSHGGSDAIGTARALEIGYAMVRYKLLEKIRETLAVSHEDMALPEVSLDGNILDVPPPPSAAAEASDL